MTILGSHIGPALKRLKKPFALRVLPFIAVALFVMAACGEPATPTLGAVADASIPTASPADADDADPPPIDSTVVVAPSDLQTGLKTELSAWRAFTLFLGHR